MQHSRRKLATVAIALLISLTILLPVSPAQPIGLLISIAPPLISYLIEAVEAHNSVKWNEDANTKLDEVMNMSVGFTDELKQLNILLNKTPEDFSIFVDKNLKARMKQFEIYRPQLEKYKTLVNPEQATLQQFSFDLDHDVFLSCEYGAAAYETTYTATIVVRALYKYIGRSPDVQKEFFEKIAECYKSWLDASKDNSPAKLANNEEKQVAELGNQLADIEKGNLARRMADKYYYQTRADYEHHKKNEAQLEEVVSQLKSYHASLLAVSNGGRLLLPSRTKSKSHK